MKNSKERTAIWLYPETIKRLDSWIKKDNCKSRSEFMEKALLFYIGYLSVTNEDTSSYLSKTLMSGVQGMLQIMENRVANNLFRLSVEVSMMMHLLAANLDITDIELQRLRGRCISDVKNTRGKISLEQAVEFQQGISGDE